MNTQGPSRVWAAEGVVIASGVGVFVSHLNQTKVVSITMKHLRES